MRPLINDLVNIALTQVGVKEVGGNNIGPQIREYQKATFLNPGAWPWCAAFMCWCIREWVVKTPGVQQALKIQSDETSIWRPKTAGAFAFVDWGRKEKLYITDEKELAKAGDIVVFDFSHIGIVIKDQVAGETFIHTVEGNTNNKGARDSNTGDGVWQKKREVTCVRNYIRIFK